MEKINIVLDRQDLEALLRGMYVSYNHMEIALLKKYGSYTGGFKDEWTWYLENASIEELVELYKILKEKI